MIPDEGGILTEPATEPLSVYDVCDSPASGVETAQVRLVLVRPGTRTLTLDFCGHHFSVYELRLTLEGWVVVNDNRGGTEIRKSPPSTSDDSSGHIVGGNYGSWDNGGR